MSYVGAELLKMKQRAIAAKSAEDERRFRHSGAFLSSSAAGLFMITGGLVFALSFTLGLFTGKSLESQTVAFGIGGYIAIALGIFLLKLPGIVGKNDKELQRLKEVASSATDGYLLSMLSELTTYGIVTDGRKDRTHFMDGDYEFTAMRNGNPVDITVRDFNDEIVFMLNGERLRKSVNA